MPNQMIRPPIRGVTWECFLRLAQGLSISPQRSARGKSMTAAMVAVAAESRKERMARNISLSPVRGVVPVSSRERVRNVVNGE